LPALSRNSPVLLGNNIPLQQIGIMKHHRQFGARQIGLFLVSAEAGRRLAEQKGATELHITIAGIGAPKKVVAAL
jgi:hypothetical protein